MPMFYEFFAGGGMARAGLGEGWRCLFANDIDSKKGASYLDNWKDKVLKVENVGRLTTSDLPGTPDLVWASFPCQDLSLAGNGAGLSGERSGTFWQFWELVKGLHAEERHPSVIVLENVCGALTSHDGSDFRSLVRALGLEGYKTGAVVIDAALFVPQSRPRLFIIGVRDEVPTHGLTTEEPSSPFHTTAIRTAYLNLPVVDRKAWLWWKLPMPEQRTKTFADIMENDAPWHTKKQTDFAARREPVQRLPRQASHYAQIVGHFLEVKQSKQIGKAMSAHFQRLSKYHDKLLGIAKAADDENADD